MKKKRKTFLLFLTDLDMQFPTIPANPPLLNRHRIFQTESILPSFCLIEPGAIACTGQTFKHR